MLNARLVQIVLLMSVLALIGVFLVACGSADEPETTATPAATAIPAETNAPTVPPSDGEVFELKYSSPQSPLPFQISEV